MTKFYGLDVLNTRRYVYQDVDNATNKLQATINAVNNIRLEPDLKYVHGNDKLHEFIEGSLEVISSIGILKTDVLINRDGQYPFCNETGGATDPAGAQYYAILVKHSRRYVVQLKDGVKNPLRATIKIIEKSDNDGASDICFGFWHNRIREFVENSFAEVSKDDVNPTDYLIDYAV